MCLSIPSNVISICGNKAVVSVGGTEVEASLQLIDDINIDDSVLLHTGFAIRKTSEKDAEETMKLLNEFAEIDRKIRDDENHKIIS